MFGGGLRGLVSTGGFGRDGPEAPQIADLRRLTQGRTRKSEQAAMLLLQGIRPL
jgi:hypothetical protein